MYEGVVQDLIDELGRLPGVGPKGAQRIAFHLLQAEEPDVRRLADVLIEVKARVKFCSICFNVSEDDQCRICRDPRRDQTILCVVEEYKDVVAIERTREFKGRYHVLGGAISPIDGIGPEQLRVRELMMRLSDGTVTELILATDPNLEGEATATYLTRMLKDLDLTVTRLASGLPVGGDLEYADEVTLGRALAGRRSAHERRDGHRPARRRTSPQSIADSVLELPARPARDRRGKATSASAISLLLLEISQISLAGARLGAQRDFEPRQEYQPDVGPESDLDDMRLRLAEMLDNLDTYSYVFDPYVPGVVESQLSDDLTSIASDLETGLRHYREGDVAEALWWWQFSYVSSWGNLAGVSLNALLSVVAHDRLDAEFTGEDEDRRGRQ